MFSLDLMRIGEEWDMKKCNKISLFKDMTQAFSKIPDKEVEKDKKIEKVNKDAAVMFICCIGVLFVIYEILIGANLCKFDFSHFYGFVGVVEYCVLLFFCHRNAVKGNPYVLLYAIWSFIVLPIAIDNIILDLLGNTLAHLEPVGLFLMIPLLIAIVSVGFMYWVASMIYKKSSNK